MRRLLAGHHLAPLAVGAMALMVAAAGGAYAASTGAGTITVCIHHDGGGLYQANRCARHDRKLSWNANGQAGPAGAQGRQGPPGAPGAQGQQGSQGNQGAIGPAGPSATKLFAQINADATVNASGSPVTTDHLNTGDYLINFGQDITHCVAIADQGQLPVYSAPGGSTGANQGIAEITIASAGGNWVAGFPTADTVRVFTHSGTTQADAPFYLAVFC